MNDTPNALVSETGHTTNLTTPGGQFCITGQADCVFYDTAHRLDFVPLKIVSVGFANGSTPSQWAAVRVVGGTAEVAATWPVAAPIPGYAFNSAAQAVRYGADYLGTIFDYRRACYPAAASRPLCH